MVNKKIINEIPNRIGIHYDLVRDAHPFTPKELKNYSNKVVCWIEVTYCGIIVEDRECAWRIEDLNYVEITFWKPAKGSGILSLSVSAKDMKSETILQSMHYTDDAYNWLLDLAEIMVNIFNTSLKISDNGFDV